MSVPLNETHSLLTGPPSNTSSDLGSRVANDEAMEEEGRAFTCFRNLPLELRLLIWQFALPGPRLVEIAQRRLKQTIGEWESERGGKWPVQPGDANHPFTFPDDSDFETDTLSDDEEEAGDESDNPWANIDSRRGLSELNRQASRSAVGTAIGAYKYDEEAYRNGHLLGITSKCPIPNMTYACRESYILVRESYQLVFSCLNSIPQTLFNYDQDTLYLRHDTFSEYFKEDGIDSIIDGLTRDFAVVDYWSLAKVTHLAVLVDPKNEIPNEGWLPDLLRIFKNVECLTMVLRHFSWEEKEGSPVSLVHPVDADADLAAYKELLSSPPGPNLRMPESSLLDTFPAYVNLTKLKEHSVADEKTGIRWKVPRFEAKVAMTKDLWEKLDAEEDKCWDFVNKHRVASQPLSGQGGEAFVLAEE